MRYAFLTAGWAGALLLSAAAERSVVAGLLAPLTFSALAVAGVVGMSGVRRRLWISGGLAVAWAIGVWLTPIIAIPAATIAITLIGVAFVGFVAFAILSDFFRAERITSDILWGTVGVYLLIATAFALLFGAVEAAAPGSLSGVQLDGRSFIYFSLVTMTTLGYGDIVPVTSLARLLASFTALTGVMYTAVVVARLVALEIAAALSLRTTDRDGD